MSKKIKLEDWKVYSSVEDKGISNNLSGSPIWANCDHAEEVPAGFSGFEYTVAFDGTVPVQVKKVKKYTT